MNEELAKAIEVCQGYGYEVIDHDTYNRLDDAGLAYEMLKQGINTLYEHYRYEPQAFEQAFSTFIYNVLGKVV